MANNVYVYMEENQHVMTNNTGSDILQFQLLVLMGLVAVADEDIAAGEDGGFHVEDGLVIRANVDSVDGDGQDGENDFDTIGNKVYLTPDGKFSDTKTVGYYEIGTLNAAKASDGHIEFFKNRYAEMVTTSAEKTFFSENATLTAVAAGTAVEIISDTTATDRKVHITNVMFKVNGENAWTDDTATLVKVQDNADVPVAAISVAKAGLTGNALLGMHSANVTVSDGVALATGMTSGKGISIVGDGDFTAGSDIVVRVDGYIE